jgi:hypothetical protein
MSPEHDTDPNAAPPTSGNTTDPTFPPKIGKQGPKAVQVTAVQGPGVDPPPKEVTTTERLLTGLLDGAKPPVKPPRKKDSSGDDAAAYSASPRPVPVAHKEADEPAVIVAPPSLRRVKDEAENGVSKSTRDEPTVELPRARRRRLGPILAAALGGVLILLLYFLLRTPSQAPAPPLAAPQVSVPVATTPIPPPEPVTTPAPTDTLPDPVIESQKLQHPRSSASAAPAPRPSAPPPAASAAPSASPPPPPTAAPTPPGAAPDFDELKKGIKH